LPQGASFHALHVEHVTAKQHRGSDDPENLALACNRCNSHKGPNLTSIDPESGQLIELFNPRRHVWIDHFDLHDGAVIGLTAIGRATALLLEMNDPERVALRLQWSQQSDGPA
jgi:hypothetical protein